MTKMELTVILLFPMFILAFSLVSINTSNELNSFTKQINLESKDASKIITNWEKVGITDNEKLKELASLNKNTLTAVESLYSKYSQFSTNMSEWLNKQFYIFMFISLSNIYLVITIYRKHNNAKKNL